MGFYKGIDGTGDGRILEALSLANLPSRELIAGGAIEGYEIIHKFGRIGSATTSWQNVSDLGGFIPFTGVNMITPIIVSKNKIPKDANAYFKFTDISDDSKKIVKKHLYDVEQQMKKDYLTNIALDFLNLKK